MSCGHALHTHAHTQTLMGKKSSMFSWKPPGGEKRKFTFGCESCIFTVLSVCKILWSLLGTLAHAERQPPSELPSWIRKHKTPGPFEKSIRVYFRFWGRSYALALWLFNELETVSLQIHTCTDTQLVCKLSITALKEKVRYLLKQPTEEGKKIN